MVTFQIPVRFIITEAPGTLVIWKAVPPVYMLPRDSSQYDGNKYGERYGCLLDSINAGPSRPTASSLLSIATRVVLEKGTSKLWGLFAVETPSFV